MSGYTHQNSIPRRPKVRNLYTLGADQLAFVDRIASELLPTAERDFRYYLASQLQLHGGIISNTSLRNAISAALVKVMPTAVLEEAQP